MILFRYVAGIQLFYVNRLVYIYMYYYIMYLFMYNFDIADNR